MALLERRDAAAREFLKPCVLSWRQAGPSAVSSGQHAEPSAGIPEPIEFPQGEGIKIASTSRSSEQVEGLLGSPASPASGLTVEIPHSETIQSASMAILDDFNEAAQDLPPSPPQSGLAVPEQGKNVGEGSTLGHPDEAASGFPGASPELGLTVEFWQGEGISTPTLDHRVEAAPILLPAPPHPRLAGSIEQDEDIHRTSRDSALEAGPTVDFKQNEAAQSVSKGTSGLPDETTGLSASPARDLESTRTMSTSVTGQRVEASADARESSPEPGVAVELQRGEGVQSGSATSGHRV